MLIPVTMRSEIRESLPEETILKRAIIIADSARLRESLRAVLKSVEDIQVIDVAPDSDLGLVMVRENYPDLIFFNMTQSSEAPADFLHIVKRDFPRTKCVVLVENIEQIRQARKAGTDGILLRGFSVAELHEQLKMMK